MGQFSWLDCITQEQVLDNTRRDVYVLVPKEFGGGHIKESCYDGYGHFGMYDIYELVVEWNKNNFDIAFNNVDTWKCGDWIKAYKEDLIRYAKGEELRSGTELRILGIALACYDEDNARIKYPIKITHDETAIYEDCQPSLGDPDQGWKSSDDDEKEDWG